MKALINSMLILVWNVSNNLANYLSMALDPNMKATYDFMVTASNSTKLIFENMEAQLEAILTSNSISILDLFRNLAVK